MDLGLTGKIAIVTGSTRGLGFATVKALLAEGCNVTVCARGEEGLAAAVVELRSLPGGTERILAIQADLSSDKGVADRFELLSDREREVFQLIAEGKTNKDMAAILSISPSTVETHRARIMEKLDLHSAAEIVLYAVRRGVIR